MNHTLEFTLTVSNCLSCHFCPQDKLKAAYPPDALKVMTMWNFTRIMEKLPPHVRIDLSGFSEPLLNPLCAEMIKAASDAGREIHIYTTLTGLTKAQIPQLAASKINYIRLHLPDETGLKIAARFWLPRFRLFMETGHKVTAMAMSNTVDPLIVAELAQHQIKIEYPDMLSRGGNLGDIVPVKHLTGPIRCAAERWHNNVVLPNGAVYACCMDFGLSMPLGNLLFQSYDEIHLQAEEYANNHNPPDTSICRDCSWAAPL
jgi:radical SAM protein with 4Fe4S-binding SPASM domain